jgi:elongation factor G
VATEASKVRTIAITGQGSSGKTSIADALVFAAGGNSRLGRVDEESSLFDTEPEEIRRRCTISSSVHTATWNKHALSIVDTPGQGNFILDANFSLRGVASMVLVIDPTAAPRAEFAKVWNWAKAEGVPTIAFVNRLDRPDIDLPAALSQVEAVLEVRTSLLQLPVGTGDKLSGVGDVVTGKAHTYDGESGKFTAAPAAGDLAKQLATLKAKLTEDAAEGDDALLEKYLEAGELTDEEVLRGLRAAVGKRTVLPVLCGSAARNIGFPQLLDAIVDLLPAPMDAGPERGQDARGNPVEIPPNPSAPFCGFVFRTLIDPHAGQLSVLRVLAGTLKGDTPLVNTRTGTKERVGHVLRLDGRKTTQIDAATVGEVVALAKLKDTHSGDTLADANRQLTARRFQQFNPAISFAVAAKKRGEEDKAMQGLLRLAQEDPALHVDRDESSADILLSGTGQLHVEVACEKLERKYGVGVTLKAPKVPYRETIRKAVKAHGRLKKQTGGHGQFADCWIEVEPLARGTGFEFVDNIVGGVIPRGFIPAVEKGIRESLQKGTLTGSPVVDIKATLYDGQYHEVDSSEMAFKIAGSLAFKTALEQASPCILEPYVNLDVTVPDDCMGDVMGDLNSRRAKVEGMTQSGHSQVLKAKVPMSEVLRYAPDLTSMTSGRGSFEISFSHYEQLPEHLVARVVQETRPKPESD